MAKVNTSLLRRPERAVSRCVFGSSAGEIVLHLRALDPLEEEAATQQAEEFAKRYLRGGFWDERTGEWRSEPMPLHAIGGSAAKLSERALRIVCRMEAMQAPPEASDGYTAMELLEIAVCLPETWREMARAAARLAGQGGGSKKASAARTGSRSGRRCGTGTGTPA